MFVCMVLGVVGYNCPTGEIFCYLRTGQDIVLGVPHLKMRMVGGWIVFVSYANPVLCAYSPQLE